MLNSFLYFGLVYALAGLVFNQPQKTMKMLQKEPRNPAITPWLEFCLRVIVLLLFWAIWPLTGLWAALMPKGWK